jgi:hypothetical protein
MTTLTLSDKLLNVIMAVQRNRQLAFSEAELGLIDPENITASVKKFYYDLPLQYTTELGLKRNEHCFRAIEAFKIPDAWLETEADKLNQFSFSF